MEQSNYCRQVCRPVWAISNRCSNRRHVNSANHCQLPTSGRLPIVLVTDTEMNWKTCSQTGVICIQTNYATADVRFRQNRLIYHGQMRPDSPVDVPLTVYTIKRLMESTSMWQNQYAMARRPSILISCDIAYHHGNRKRQSLKVAIDQRCDHVEIAGRDEESSGC